MARRRRRGRGSSSRGLTIDGTAWKVGGMLFRMYNGPATVQRIQNKDWAGAMDEWGKGSLTSVLGNASLSSVGMRIKNSIGPGVKMVSSRFLKFKF